MDKIYNVQKNLKRCMKSNRKISFSIGLLISFLITGGIYTYANEYSHQIFFNGDFNRNVNFDNTLKNFSYPDYPKTLDNKDKYEYFGSYGVKKINTKYMDFVSFSADLVPKKAPNISLIKPKNSTLEIKALDNINFDNPEIKEEKINKPQNKPETKKPIKIQKIDRNPINPITLQNNVDIHIEKIEQITPKDPKYTNISPSKISNNILPQDIDIKFDKRIVAAPKLEDFTPPEPKTPVELEDTGFESIIYNEAYKLLGPDNIGNKRAEYNRGIVGQVSITEGTFKINNFADNDGCYFAYKNYDSIPNYYANPNDASYKNPIKLGDNNQKPEQFDLGSFDSPDPDDSDYLVSDDIYNVPYDNERFRTFYGLNSSAFGYFSKDVDISYISNAKNETTGNEYTNKNPNTVIYMETDSNSAQTLDNLYKYKVVPDELYKEIKGYKELSKLKDDDTFEFKKEIFPTGITLFNSEATVKLLGSYAKFVTVTTQYSNEHSNKRLSVFNNNGNISALNYTTNEDDDTDIKNQIIFYSTPDATPEYSDFQRYIYANGQKGKIDIYSKNAIGMYFTESGKYGFQNKISTAFINNGEFNIYGAHSTGVSLKRPAALGEKSGIYLLKPINIFGDEAVGVFLPGDVSKVPEENLQLRVNIGEKGNNKEKVTWTDEFPGNEDYIGGEEEEDTEKIKPKVNEIPNVGNTEDNSEDNVDYSIGLFYANSHKANIGLTDIKLGKFAKNSTAIFASDGELHISKGTINIDGEDNIGLLSQKKDNKSGSIDYVGDIKASGKGNKLAYTDDKKISIKGKVSSTSKDSVSIYADTGTIDLTKADLDINISGENVAAGYAVNNGKIKLKDESKIKITNDTPSNGTALVAKTGGVIEAKKAKIDIRNIVAGLSASDDNSMIDFTGGTLNYDGEGYSVYTDGKGKIDLSDANITLKGKAIGFDVDQDENSEQNVILNNMTRIKPESDDVILFNLKNSSDLDTKGGIRDHIISRIQNKLKKNNNAIDLTQLVIQPKAGEPGEFYKVSAMEGGNIKIGSLDKSAVSTDDINGEPDTDEKKAKKDGFQFYNRLHIQRLIATTHDNSTISAILNNSKASKFNNQVVALELSSSPSATSNDETQINIVKSKIIADRTEEGNGAIGLFINYGKIDVDEGSTISVENENKVDNAQAVGIYAVNGSEVSNKGEITVGSSNSVGILGENNRKATNNLEKDNFGDGKINISNTGTIEIKKANSTGIYANNIDKEITDNTVVNSGTIKALGEHSNGIYSHKGTISNTGTIELGDKNVGIYSDSSNIKDLGTIKFNSNNSTAIFVKGNSTIESGKTLTIENKGNLSGNVGLYSENDLVTDLNIITKGKKITSYYTKSKALTVNADITTSEDGVGINGDNGSITYEKDKTMKVSHNSFGILSHNSDVTLNGNIQLNSDLGKGIYFDSSEKNLNISGKITVNAKNVIGSYISNVTDSNKLTLTTPITFGEKADYSIAYLFNKSKFNNTSFTELKSKGTQHNTYIFALSENKINLGTNEVSIKSEDSSKGFTGIYLGESNKLTGKKIKVSDKATGIYSKDNNKVEIKNIEVDGQDTVGIYSEKNTTLKEINISSSNSAVGIYGKEGKITFSGDNILNLSNKGTGIYLEDAILNGGSIKLVNTDTNKENNLVGVYFKNSKSSKNTSNISIDNGTKLIGLYLDNAKVSNKGKIEATSGSSNTLAFVANESTFTNSGNLTLTSSDSHAIYVNNGSAENTGNITVDNKGGNKPSVAMTGMKTDKDVKLTNNGNITVSNNSIGMYLDNGAIGNNTKEIVAQKKDSVGVYVNGNTTQFTNTGKISADNIGVYLNNTEKGNIKKLGSVTLTNVNAVAVYANNSKVDFEINPTVKKGELPNNLISLYATGNTEISSKIYTANGKNSIGIYLKDNKVSFNDAYVKITEGHEDKNGVSYNTGIYADSAYSGDLNVNIENKAKNTIGIAVSKGATVNYSGKITTGKDSIGILTKGNLVTKNSTFDINGGTGIFVDSTADAKIGTEDTKMNLSNKATAIYQNGGKLTLGDKLKFGENSVGTLLISRNAEVDSNISYSVKTDSLGVGLYYTDANNHNFTSNGTITLCSDNATGIYAQSTKTATGTNTLKNKGEIITSDKIKNNIGIYADNVNVENNKVSIGEKGVGIYLTKKVNLKNTEITLNGENSVGIYSENISNGSNYSVGKITGEKNNQTGLFIFNEKYDENKNITLSDLDINLKNNSKGVGLQNANYTINKDSKIFVGNDSTGLAFKNAGANVKADITVGENSLALYAQGEKNVTFEGKIEAGKNSKWVYAKDKANITLNKFADFTVNGGLGLGVDNATITSDKETTITVNGGTGAYINNGSISDKFKIDVQNGLGLYIQNGYNGTLPTVNLTGNESKAYVLENLNKEFEVNNINLDKTNQIYIYSKKGTGKGIKASTLNINGSDNYGIYNLADQNITAKDLNISGSTSFGIYSTGTGEINVDKITVTGENSAGVYSINGNITQTGDITSKGLGIYSENGNVTLNGSKILLGDKDGIGVKAKNSSVTVSGDMTISEGIEGATGIYSEGTGDITFNNKLEVDKNIIGVYKNGTGTINLNGSRTTISENGIGVYSKGAEVINAGSLNVTSKNAKGIYVENNTLTSTGKVTIDGENAIGLAGKGGEINSGDISVKGKNAVGIYSDEAKVTSTGKIDSNSIGIYSKGSKDITQNGDITIGKDAVGIFKEGNGNVNITSENVTVGDKGYALYYLNSSSNKGTITANIKNMNLGSEAIGIYTKNGNLTYTGNITVGEKKNSAGIYADNSDVTFKGTLNVSKPETIGIFAKGHSNVTIQSGSTINVSNGSYGIMTNDGSTGSITIEQGATFNISNLSYGISAYGKNTIINNGTFNIDANSTGIFHSFDSTVSAGNIPSDKIKTLNKEANLAGIDINFNGTVKFPKNIKVVNGGTIKVNGTVDINNMYLDFEHDNKPIIDAKSIAGTAVVKSNFSMGNSVNKLVYKDVFRPRSEYGFGKFSGDVTSQSASWVAKISKTEPDTKTYDIMMVRIPYTVMLKGEKNSQLGKSLEEIRSNIPKYKESKIFKDLDNVSTEKELTDTIANIRGDIYSNIQERMLDVDNTFDKSYKEVLDSHNVTDRVHKFSVIYSKNKHIDETLGVSSYDKDSYGILYLNDRENGANKYGFSVGLICSKFNFTGPTSLGSSEEMRSGKFGLHYQRTKDNLKYLTRLELGVNKHITNRVSNVNGMKYKYNANYWSYNIDWKNRLSYDIDVTKDFRITPYANLDVTYGKIFGINEDALTDPTLKLSVKPNSYFVITPRIGIDAKYDIELKNDMHISLKGNLEYHYDLNELYKRVNMAKFSSVNTYYDLSIPGYRRSGLKVGGEVEIGKKDRYGVTFGATYDRAMKYSLRFNYKF